MTPKVKTIYRDKVWIDPKIVSDKYTHAANGVEYYCYHEIGKSDKDKPYIPEDPVKEFGAKRQSYVCFSSLMSVVHDSKKNKDGQFNRVLYHMITDPSACVNLTPEEQRRFIELSVEHLMLPAYISPDSIVDGKEGRIVIMLEGLTPSQIYMYLSQYRYLREDPGFVKSILHLHDVVGLNFYAAFVAASRVSIDYTVHHFLTLQRRYASDNTVDNITVPFSTIAGLSRFARQPSLYDDRNLMDTPYGYEASSRIEKICKIKYEARPEELLEPLLVKAIMATTDEATAKYVNHYLKLKERIKYRERKNKEAGVSAA